MIDNYSFKVPTLKHHASKIKIPTNLLLYTGQKSHFNWDNAGWVSNDEFSVTDLVDYNNKVWPEDLPVGSMIAIRDYGGFSLCCVLWNGLAILNLVTGGSIVDASDDEVYTVLKKSLSQIEYNMEDLLTEDARIQFLFDNSYDLGLVLRGREYYYDFTEYMGLIRYGWDTSIPVYSEEANAMAKRVREDHDRAIQELSEGNDDLQILSSKKSADEQLNSKYLIYDKDRERHFWNADNVTPSIELSKAYNETVWPEDLPDGSMYLIAGNANPRWYALFLIKDGRVYEYLDSHREKDIKENVYQIGLEVNENLRKVRPWFLRSAENQLQLKHDLYAYYEYLGLVRYGWDIYYKDLYKYRDTKDVDAFAKRVQDDRDRAIQELSEGDDDFQFLSSLKTSTTDDISPQPPKDLLWYREQEPHFNWDSSNVGGEIANELHSYNSSIAPSDLPLYSVFLSVSEGFIYYLCFLVPSNLPESLDVRLYWVELDLSSGGKPSLSFLYSIIDNLFKIADDSSLLDIDYAIDYDEYESCQAAMQDVRLTQYEEYLGLLRYGKVTSPYIYDNLGYSTNYSKEVDDFAKRVQDDRDRAIQELSEGDDDFQFLSSLTSHGNNETPPKDLLWYREQEPHFNWSSAPDEEVDQDDLDIYNQEVLPQYLPDKSVCISILKDMYYITHLRSIPPPNRLPSDITDEAEDYEHGDTILVSFRSITGADRPPSVEDIMSMVTILDKWQQTSLDRFPSPESCPSLKPSGWDCSSYSNYDEYRSALLDWSEEFLGVVRYGDKLISSRVNIYSEEANDMAKRVQEDRDRVNAEFAGGDDDFQFLSSLKPPIEEEVLWYTGKPKDMFALDKPPYSLSNTEKYEYNLSKWPKDMPEGSMWVMISTEGKIYLYFYISKEFGIYFNNFMWYGYKDAENFISDMVNKYKNKASLATGLLYDWSALDCGDTLEQFLSSSYFHGDELYLGLVRYGWGNIPTEQSYMSKLIQEDRERINKLIEEGGDDDFQILSSLRLSKQNKLNPSNLLWFTGQAPEVDIINKEDVVAYNQEVWPKGLPAGSLIVNHSSLCINLYCVLKSGRLLLIDYLYLINNNNTASENYQEYYDKFEACVTSIKNDSIGLHTDDQKMDLILDIAMDEERMFPSYFKDWSVYMGLMRYGFDVYREDLFNSSNAKDVFDFAKRVQEDRDRANMEFADGDDDFQFLGSLRLSQKSMDPSADFYGNLEQLKASLLSITQNIYQLSSFVTDRFSKFSKESEANNTDITGRHYNSEVCLISVKQDTAGNNTNVYNVHPMPRDKNDPIGFNHTLVVTHYQQVVTELRDMYIVAFEAYNLLNMMDLNSNLTKDIYSHLDSSMKSLNSSITQKVPNIYKDLETTLKSIPKEKGYGPVYIHGFGKVEIDKKLAEINNSVEQLMLEVEPRIETLKQYDKMQNKGQDGEESSGDTPNIPVSRGNSSETK